MVADITMAKSVLVFFIFINTLQNKVNPVQKELIEYKLFTEFTVQVSDLEVTHRIM